MALIPNTMSTLQQFSVDVWTYEALCMYYIKHYARMEYRRSISSRFSRNKILKKCFLGNDSRSRAWIKEHFKCSHKNNRLRIHLNTSIIVEELIILVLSNRNESSWSNRKYTIKSINKDLTLLVARLKTCFWSVRSMPLLTLLIYAL